MLCRNKTGAVGGDKKKWEEKHTDFQSPPFVALFATDVYTE